jgi:hypothetical protein
VTDEPERCRAGRRCADGENVYDPETREHIDRLGKIIYEPGLCDRCINRVKYALNSLPGAIVELSELLVPYGRRQHRDPDMPPLHWVMTSPPLPLRRDVLDLQLLIDHEVRVWMTSLIVSSHGMTLHAHFHLAPMRHRVERACEILRANVTAFLALRHQEHPARNLSVRRDAGLDPDEAIRRGNDIYMLRDGIAGALRLIELDEKATRYAGRHPGDKLGTPCPDCHHMALFREHHLKKVQCRVCHRQFSDDDFDAFMAEVYKAFGIDR